MQNSMIIIIIIYIAINNNKAMAVSTHIYKCNIESNVLSYMYVSWE